MTVFDILTMLGGLCLFLFGMNIMGEALERRAGGKLQNLLSKLTTGKIAGLLTGLGVTAIIQSSSATTVMVVGFVNSGLMSLKQSINVIMGANIGTTVTAWILSLSGLSGDSLFLKLLKPMSFTPVLALVGIIFYMFCKNSTKKDNGMILLGFATLMFGMDIMTDSVSGLADIPAFQEVFLMFQNPILGVLAGAILTAMIQSSSASVGILQALAITGQVTYGAAIPIIMGQNIGTCITAILSSFGTNRNAKRAALVHLSFNVIGTVICLFVFSVVKVTLSPALFGANASMAGIATCHSIFNVLCTILLLPMSSFLEKIAYRLVPEKTQPDKIEELDERLLATPAVALDRCRVLACSMANDAVTALKESITCLTTGYSKELAQSVRDKEETTDHYEDIIGTYLVKLSSRQIGDHESTRAGMLLKIIGDLERISDHASDIIDSAEEMHNKGLSFSDAGSKDIANMSAAVSEILDHSYTAFTKNDLSAAGNVEPLEQVIDVLKKQIRTNHITRLQQGGCTIEAGFVLNDLVTSFERTSDHCSNIAGSILDAEQNNMNIHEYLRAVKRDSPLFKEKYSEYARKYLKA